MSLLSEQVTVVTVSTDASVMPGMMLTANPTADFGSITLQFPDGSRLVRKVATADLSQYSAGQALHYSLSV